MGMGGVQLRDMRTVRALREAAPDPGAAERLSDRALYAAVENPDHSEAGRAAAAEALRARGLAPQRWRLAAPGFVRAQDLANGERAFFGWGRALRRALAAIAALSFVALMVSLFVPLPSVAQFALAISGGAALLWLALTALRLHPARVVVLRRPTRDSALRRMIGRELRAYGHVIALGEGDEHADPIANARQYRLFAQRLGDRIGLNLQAPLSRAETLACDPAPGWRDLAVQLLTGSGDAVIVDLSHIADEPPPELAAIAEEGIGARCVFVALWGKADAAEAAVRAAGFAHPCFYYAPDGEMQRRPRFRAALLDAMRATHGVHP